MPQGQTVLGPVQVNNAIIRTSAISTAITLLNQQGSQIIQGSMQLIPVGNSIVYVRPFYAQGRGSGAYPQFQFVVVFSQDYGAYCAPTVQDGLNQMLGRAQTITTCNVSQGQQSGGTGTGPATTTTHAHHHARRGHDDHRPAGHAPPSRRRPGASSTCSTRPRPSSTRRRRRSTATAGPGYLSNAGRPRPKLLVKQAQNAPAG